MKPLFQASVLCAFVGLIKSLVLVLINVFMLNVFSTNIIGSGTLSGGGVRCAASIMLYRHEVHRDLKSLNVFLLFPFREDCSIVHCKARLLARSSSQGARHNGELLGHFFQRSVTSVFRASVATVDRSVCLPLRVQAEQ